MALNITTAATLLGATSRKVAPRISWNPPGYLPEFMPI